MTTLGRNDLQATTQAMTAGVAARWPSGAPKCSQRKGKPGACPRKASYVCRGCGKAYCGHCAAHPIRWEDERVSPEMRGTCLCRGCAK